MLTRTRNELLVAGALAALILGVGALYFRARADRGATSLATAGVKTWSDDAPGDRCPELGSWVASPLQTSVGAWIDVGAAATDPDRGETLRYAWLPAANFERSRAATTRYRCTEAGRHELELDVSDNHAPFGCVTHLVMTVDCVAP